MMDIHSNNETDKTTNVSKIANTSTLDDNSTAAGCKSRLMIRWSYRSRFGVIGVGFATTATRRSV